MAHLLGINMDITGATHLTNCLACGSSDLEPVLNLNDQPLANNFLATTKDHEPAWPLAVNVCKHCYHLQLTHAVDPALIYTHYLYVSGTSRTQHEYMEWFAKFAREYYADLPATVLDIGCNDGTQLHYFKQLGVSTHGIDPAENLYSTSSKEHTIMCDFFNADSADKFLAQYGKMDLVVAQNSFAHNPDPVGYLTALRRVINPDGLFFIQTSQANMVLNNEFDTIYHEHVNFYNINSMRELCRRTGFNLVDVQKTPIHGTSYIFVLGVNRASPNRIDNLIETERLSGLYDLATYHAWTRTVGETINRLRLQCRTFAERGYKLIGYGAAAKGNTLLNASKIQLDSIIDDNPLKQGLYSPGLHIPVVGIDSLTAISVNQPVVFIPLAWNFFKEIRARILSHRSVEHDRFVRYFPKVTVE